VLKADVWVFGFAFEHHGNFSAFHRLNNYLPDTIRKINIKFSGVRMLPRPLRHRLRSLYLSCAEKRLLREAIRWRPRLIHFLYPENCFSYGCFQHHFSGRVLLTLHQPSSVLPSFISSRQGLAFIETAKRADRLIALAPNVVNGYRTFFQNKNVRVIPHGVDTGYFCCSSQAKKMPIVLTVGNWMRDFRLWDEVALEFLRQKRSERFCLVTNPENIQRWDLQQRTNIDFRHHLSDQAIRRLYDHAGCLFLPLTDSVANNALLEGLAMGKRILVTDLPGTKFYGKSRVFYINKDRGAREAAAQLDQLLAKEAKPEEGLALRRYADQAFGWPKIAALYQEEYTSCIS